MASLRSNRWEFLAYVVIGLSIVLLLAPVSGLPARILSGVLFVFSLTFVVVGRWEDRRNRAKRSSDQM